mmetsp:Transcript_30801/g.30307  ORF Transcript_30801/g.30307 Transcript_30801/m.30307 type:complete len:225 (+) Transcript_30801:47-721(+)
MEMEKSKVLRIYLTQEDLEQERLYAQEDLAQQSQEKFLQQQLQSHFQQEAHSKKNTILSEKDAGFRSIKIPPKVPAYEFEDIMIATCKKGQAVENYFKEFATFQQGTYFLELEQFFEALKKLGLKWADQKHVTELFEAIDQASHMDRLERIIDVRDIGNVVLCNSPVTVDEMQSKYVYQIYISLKQKQMLSKIRNIFQFFNQRRDSTCTAKEFKGALLEQLKLG